VVEDSKYVVFSPRIHKSRNLAFNTRRSIILAFFVDGSPPLRIRSENTAKLSDMFPNRQYFYPFTCRWERR